MTKEELISQITSTISANGNQDITGTKLQEVLVSIVNTLYSAIDEAAIDASPEDFTELILQSLGTRVDATMSQKAITDALTALNYGINAIPVFARIDRVDPAQAPSIVNSSTELPGEIVYVIYEHPYFQEGFYWKASDNNYYTWFADAHLYKVDVNTPVRYNKLFECAEDGKQYVIVAGSTTAKPNLVMLGADSGSAVVESNDIPKFNGVIKSVPSIISAVAPTYEGIYFSEGDYTFVAKLGTDYYASWDTSHLYKDGPGVIESRLFEYNKQLYMYDGKALNLLSDMTKMAGYVYIGIATPSTTPITLTGGEKVFYIATEEGDYSNFGLGNISELSIIKSENGSWSVDSLSFFQKEIKSEDVRLSDFLISYTTIKPNGSVQSSNERYSVYKFQNKGYSKLQGVASGYSDNYLIALYSDESCSSDSFISGVKATLNYNTQSYSLEVPSECKIIVISQYSLASSSTCTASTYFSYTKLDKIEDKLTELDNIVSAPGVIDIAPFKKTQGVYFRKDVTKVLLTSSNTCAMWEYKIDNISSKQIQVNISQSKLAGTTGLGPSGVLAGLFLSNGSENPSDYTCISVLQLGDTAIFDYELDVPLASSADLLCVSFRQNLNEDSKASVTTNGQSLIERVEILENNANNANIEDSNYDGVAVVRSGSSILGFGASFMRGNSEGIGVNNSWLHILSQSLGCTAINNALGGTNIMYHANKLFNLEIYTDSQIDNIDAVIIMHTHDKDVFTLPSEFVNYSVEDYESNVLPFATTSGTNEEDVIYAKAFDYVIKKIYQLNFLHKYDTSYTDSMHQYVGTKYFKPTQIILVTHWHDQREVYNKSVRKLASKWGIPLVQLDKKIGFTKNSNNPAFNNQPSLEFVGNIEGASPIETINGVAYGWHPMCGNNEVFIQRKIAAICKQSFVSI